MYYLKQSTASQEVLLGPFVDSTDGNTAETGLTIANTDIKIHVAGATTLANKNSGGATHISGGNYYAVLDATDTATLGSGCIIVQVAGALAVRVDICILAANVYDSLIGGGDVLDVSTTQFNGTNVTASSGRPEVNATHWAGTAVGSTTVRADLINIAGAAVSTTTAQLGVNAVQISGDGTAADNLETAFDDTAGAVRWTGVIDQGTAQAATGTTLQLRSAAGFADDELNGATIQITGGSTGVGQSRLITDYVSATDTATVDTWATTPSGTITYKIFGTAPSTGGSGLDAAGVRSAIGLASANLDTQLSGLDTKLDTIDNFVDTEVSTIVTQTGAAAIRTAVGLASANLDTQLGTLATQASVNTIDDFLDTEVAAIKAKTDQLTFTVANVLDANVQNINDVAITGDGSGTPFNV